MSSRFATACRETVPWPQCFARSTMRRIPYSPRVDTWKAAGEFPITSLGIVRARYLAVNPSRLPELGSARAPFLPHRGGRIDQSGEGRSGAAHARSPCTGVRLGGNRCPQRGGAMPVGEAEVRAGALARAREALERTGAEVAFGLEGGAILDGDRAWL